MFRTRGIGYLWAVGAFTFGEGGAEGQARTRPALPNVRGPHYVGQRHMAGGCGGRWATSVPDYLQRFLTPDPPSRGDFAPLRRWSDVTVLTRVQFRNLRRRER